MLTTKFNDAAEKIVCLQDVHRRRRELAVRSFSPLEILGLALVDRPLTKIRHVFRKMRKAVGVLKMANEETAKYASINTPQIVRDELASHTFEKEVQQRINATLVYNAKKDPRRSYCAPGEDPPTSSIYVNRAWLEDHVMTAMTLGFFQKKMKGLAMRAFDECRDCRHLQEEGRVELIAAYKLPAAK